MTWMLYGATGYTGKLIVEEAVRRGHKPLLAGRSAEKLAALGERYGLPYIAFDIDTAPLFVANSGIRAVLHAAGPFVQTSQPMVDACLRAGVHYLDITGEIPVYEAVFARDAEAQARGIALISGVGFDIVPSDCLAKAVADKLPGADTLETFFDTQTMDGEIGITAGTLKSLVGMLPNGSRVRRGGLVLPYDLGAGGKIVSFGGQMRHMMPIPWGDVFTAYYSTGIPNITVYLALQPREWHTLRASGVLLQTLLRAAPLRRLLDRAFDTYVPGPSAARLQNGRALLHARVSRSSDGANAEGWMQTPEAYAFTAHSAINAVERVLSGSYARNGALTPSIAFGADFALSVAGVKIADTPSFA
jgi:short subunit dehydrogenase-like uncharacterized protein